MAKKIILTLKFLFLWGGYSYAISPIAKGVLLTLDAPMTEEPILFIYCFFSAMLWLPEMLLFFSKGFRDWIKAALENNDGKLDRDDLNDLLPHYASILCIKIFVMMSLRMTYYNWSVDLQFYVIPLIGSMGVSGLSIIKKIYAK